MTQQDLRSWIDLVNESFISEAIEDVIDTLYPYRDRDDIFVSFSNIPKLGINPKTSYNTPAGIYTYPIKDIWHQIESDTVPYAGERNYVLVLRPKTPQGVLDVATYTEAEYQHHVGILRNQLLPSLLSADKTIDPVDINELIEDAEESTKLKTPAGKIWNVTRLAATKMSEQLAGATAPRATAAWNMLLRRLGITGVVDHGSGLIHPNEPFQAVWTSAEPLELLSITRNVRKKGLSTDQIKRWLEYDSTRIFGVHHKTTDLWLVALKKPVEVLRFAVGDKVRIPEKALVLASRYYGKNWTEFVILDMLETKYPLSQKFLASLALHCRAAFIPLVEKRRLTRDLAIISVTHWPGRLKQLRDHGRDIPTELVDVATQHHDEDAAWAAVNLRFITSQTEANCRARLGNEAFEILRRRFDRTQT